MAAYWLDGAACVAASFFVFNDEADGKARSELPPIPTALTTTNAITNGATATNAITTGATTTTTTCKERRRRMRAAWAARRRPSAWCTQLNARRRGRVAKKPLEDAAPARLARAAREEEEHGEQRRRVVATPSHTAMD